MKNKKFKNKISISIDPNILKSLDDITSNRSNYIDNVLLSFFKEKGHDTSKIKL